MSQYIVFDLGGVIFNVNFKDFWQIISELNVDKPDMEHYMRLIEKPEFTGLANMRDLLEDEFLESDADMLIRAWNEAITLNEQMFNFLKTLNHEGFKIAFLSNIGFEQLNYIRKTFPKVLELAHIQHMSCEVGIAKPSLLFYQSFLMQNDQFAGAIYLDDKQENIIAGSKCKFDSIKFDLNDFNNKPPSAIKKELDRIKERLLRS